MSVIGKKPYISKVLDTLTNTELKTLQNLMNGSGDQTELLRILGYASGNRTPITVADKGVHVCSLQVGPTLYKGYLLYTNSFCTLVNFTDFQVLSLFEITEKEFNTVSEFLDINELRRLVNEKLIIAGELVSVDVADIDSGSEPAGKAIVSDGEGGAAWGEASGGGDLLVEKTYAELVALRNNAQLVPGQWYRITDYTCTTATANTRSAGHVFDIIVLALDESHLSENAHALQHDGDTYFADSKLEAWQLKYCLDNDTTRFAWADTVNGKGVIYYLKDEFGNEVPYDFKNIVYDFAKSFSYSQWGSDWTFVRDTSLDADGYFGWRTSDGSTPIGWSNPYCFTDTENITIASTLYSNTSGSTISFGGSITSVSTSGFSTYTFNYETYDASLVGGTQKCFNNFIGEYRVNGVLQLNWTLFYLSSSGTLQAYDNHIAEGNHNNSFIGSDFYNNQIGSSFNSNTVGSSFNSNTIGSDFNSNTVGSNFQYNIVGYNFNSNTIGSDFSYNTVGSYFYSNTVSSNFCNNNIDYNFQYNTIGSSFYNNNIGYNFSYNNNIGYNFNSNTIGSDFNYNNIGSIFQHNTVGSNFRYNTVGSNFSYNNIGSYFSSNTIGSSTSENVYVRYCQFDDGVHHISLTSNDTSASGSNQIQNVHIHSGIMGTSDSNRLTISVPDRNLAYSLDYYANGSQDITLS